jgi:hypothetical protein
MLQPATVQSYRPWLPWILAGLLLKLLLWFFFPLLDDESYFIQWAYFPDWGWYDHPPMVGWIIMALRPLADHYLLYRAFPFLTAVLVAALIYLLLKRDYPEAAVPASVLSWVSLPSIAHFSMLNDTCLVFFSALTMFFFLRWLDDPRARYAIATGLSWGAAFLSKYLAVLMGPAFLFLIFWCQGRRAWRFILWMFPTVLPLVAINLLWNANNCWNNLLFNFVTRHSEPDGFQTHTYILTLVVLVGPPLLWAFLSHGRTLLSRLDTLPGRSFLLVLVPLLIFFPMSSKKLIGAHWLLPFMLPAYLTTATFTTSTQTALRRVGFGISLVLATIPLLGLLAWNLGVLPVNAQTNALLFFTRTPEVCRILDETIPAGVTRVAKAYTFAAVFHHRCQVPTYGMFRLGRHGRQSDKDLDLRALDHQPIAVILGSASTRDVARYFRSGRLIERPLGEGHLWIYLGEDFQFDLYREKMLTQVREKYYQRPAWLPAPRACEFTTRYFSEESR